jgi:hypothetical protein
MDVNKSCLQLFAAVEIIKVKSKLIHIDSEIDEDDEMRGHFEAAPDDDSDYFHGRNNPSQWRPCRARAATT